MPSKKNASENLRQFFADELRNNSNATLEEAKLHLAALFEAGPADPIVGEATDLLSETIELIHTHDEHTPLSDFV